MPTRKRVILRSAETVFRQTEMTEDALIRSMRLHRLKADKIVQPIMDALEAVKKDGGVDHAARLKAAKMGMELLRFDYVNAVPPVKGSKTTIPTPSDVKEALSNMDEVQLSTAIFRKSSE